MTRIGTSARRPAWQRSASPIGVFGTLAGVGLNLGCCLQILGPAAPVLFAGGAVDLVPVAWRMPLLYGSVAVALGGFGVGWRRHRRWGPLLVYLAGAGALLYPFHEALDVWVLQRLVWTGLGLVLVAVAWEVWSLRASCRPAGSSRESGP